MIEDNIKGIGYEFGNDDALVEVLEKVQRNPQEVIAMKTACLKKAEEFSPKSIVGEFIRKFF